MNDVILFAGKASITLPEAFDSYLNSIFNPDQPKSVSGKIPRIHYNT